MGLMPLKGSHLKLKIIGCLSFCLHLTFLITFLNVKSHTCKVGTLRMSTLGCLPRTILLWKKYLKCFSIKLHWYELIMYVSLCLNNGRSWQSFGWKQLVSNECKVCLWWRMFHLFTFLFSIVGRIVFQLFSDICPKTSKNFLSLCTGKSRTNAFTLFCLNFVQ